MNRPLFPTILSIPSYDIGKKVGLRTYQQPHLAGYTVKTKSNLQLKIPLSEQTLLRKHKILYSCLHFRSVVSTVIVSFNDNLFLWIIVRCFNQGKCIEFYSVVKHYLFLRQPHLTTNEQNPYGEANTSNLLT